MNARFAFRSPEFTVEVSGTEEFVAEQIDVVRDRVREILSRQGIGAAGVSAPATPEAAEKPRSPLEEFYRNARVREGKGALQDSVLLFAHYISEKQGKPEFSIEDLNLCFDMLAIPRPKSLANTLGILRRNRGWLESGARRGTYSLTPRGKERVAGLL